MGHPVFEGFGLLLFGGLKRLLKTIGEKLLPQRPKPQQFCITYGTAKSRALTKQLLFRSLFCVSFLPLTRGIIFDPVFASCSYFQVGTVFQLDVQCVEAGGCIGGAEAEDIVVGHVI